MNILTALRTLLMPTLPNSEITVTADGTLHIVHTGPLHLHFNYGSEEQTALLTEIIANQADSKEREETMVNRTAEFSAALVAFMAAFTAYKTAVEAERAAHAQADADFAAKIKQLTDDDALEDTAVADAIDQLNTAKAAIPTATAPDVPPVIDGAGSGGGTTGTDPATGGGTGGVSDANPL